MHLSHDPYFIEIWEVKLQKYVLKNNLKICT